MSNCRSCGAEIVWALTEKEKRIPLDPGAAEDGNLELTGFDGKHYHVRSIVLGDHVPLENRRRSHFASCPDADTWRK